MINIYIVSVLKDMHFRVFATQTVPSGIAKRVGVKERINLPPLKVAVDISCRGKHSWIKISLRWRWGRGLNFIPVKNKINQYLNMFNMFLLLWVRSFWSRRIKDLLIHLVTERHLPEVFALRFYWSGRCHYREIWEL